jgi:hypothetical protein
MHKSEEEEEVIASVNKHMLLAKVETFRHPELFTKVENYITASISFSEEIRATLKRVMSLPCNAHFTVYELMMHVAKETRSVYAYVHGTYEFHYVGC